MDTSHGIEFANRLVGLAEVFDAKLSPQRIALYFEALKDISFMKVAHALNQSLKVCKFFPKPAEIRALALGEIEDRAEIAWVSFRKAMSVAGSYASLSIMDAALAETITAIFGTWPAACAADLSPEMWASKRKEFGRVYKVMAGRDLDGSRYLPGVSEQTNSGRADWLRFVPVHRVDSEGVSPALSLKAAEKERQHIAALSSGFTTMKDGLQNVFTMIENQAKNPAS